MSPGANKMTVPDKKKVFIIHGRNESATREMGIFLRSLGLEPVWFRDVRQEMGGTATIAGVVERGMEVAQGVLALFTPDEFSVLRPELRKTGDAGEHLQRWQARPNVLFEAGMAFGRDRDRVAFVLFGDVKLFTDALGIHMFWPGNDHGADSHRTQLRGLLGNGMGCAVNKDSNDWMGAGDFDSVTKGLTASPEDPFRVALPAAATSAVGEVEALALIKNWLNTHPARSENLNYDQVNAALPVKIAHDVLRRVLPQATGGGWTVEAHEHSVVLTYRPPPMTVSPSRRGY